MQNFINAMNKACSQERAKYHLTVGGMITKLQECDHSLPLMFDNLDGYPSLPHSYRGFYVDAALEPSDKPTTVRDFLNGLKGCLGSTMEGYKGGDYVIEDDTPLWAAEEGDSSGIAIVDIRQNDSCVIIETKDVG